MEMAIKDITATDDGPSSPRDYNEASEELLEAAIAAAYRLEESFCETYQDRISDDHFTPFTYKNLREIAESPQNWGWIVGAGLAILEDLNLFICITEFKNKKPHTTYVRRVPKEGAPSSSKLCVPLFGVDVRAIVAMVAQGDVHRVNQHTKLGTTEIRKWMKSGVKSRREDVRRVLLELHDVYIKLGCPISVHPLGLAQYIETKQPLCEERREWIRENYIDLVEATKEKEALYLAELAAAKLEEEKAALETSLGDEFWGNVQSSLPAGAREFTDAEKEFFISARRDRLDQAMAVVKSAGDVSDMPVAAAVVEAAKEAIKTLLTEPDPVAVEVTEAVAESVSSGVPATAAFVMELPDEPEEPEERTGSCRGCRIKDAPDHRALCEECEEALISSSGAISLTKLDIPAFDGTDLQGSVMANVGKSAFEAGIINKDDYTMVAEAIHVVVSTFDQHDVELSEAGIYIRGVNHDDGPVKAKHRKRNSADGFVIADGMVFRPHMLRLLTGQIDRTLREVQGMMLDPLEDLISERDELDAALGRDGKKLLKMLRSKLLTLGAAAAELDAEIVEGDIEDRLKNF